MFTIKKPYDIIFRSRTKEVGYMNQILYTENKNNKGPADIKAVLKVFAICMLVFGIILAGTGAYALYKNVKDSQVEEVVKPTISVENNGDDTITIIVKHEKQIKDIKYSWNQENEQIVEVEEGKTSLQKVIDIPIGTNILKVIATDIDGQITEYEGKFVAEEDPKISIVAEDTNIKATITATNKISYITYRWDEEEEKRVDVGDTSFEQLIEIPQGLHTLTIIAVDINNKTTTKQQDVNGVTKPKLTVTTDGKNFMVNATDDEKLEKVEFILNGQGYRININDKDFNYSYPLEDGENKLEVTVYNSNGLTASFKAKCTKQ